MSVYRIELVKCATAAQKYGLPFSARVIDGTTGTVLFATGLHYAPGEARREAAEWAERYLEPAQVAA